MTQQTPSYLKGYEALYARDPHAAALEWFRNARYGLFMHFGVYSLLGRGEWVQLRETIHVAEYEKLKDRFRADRFDADFITDMAAEAGMRYITLTTRHHDSFCLFKTNETDFNSVQSPCGRDLVGELADACRRKGLGFMMYYSYGLDWRHPWFFGREVCDMARPAYAELEPAYRYEKEADFARYIDFVQAQLRELLTQYGPVAGLWFDPIMPVYYRPDLYRLDETYALVRSLQPQCLIAFKQGANADEDFASTEKHRTPLGPAMQKRNAPAEAVAYAGRIWDVNQHKPGEICTTMSPWWGYAECTDEERRTPEQVLEMVGEADAGGFNLLLNTGPLPDGSIHPVDAASLREAGRRLRGLGWPGRGRPRSGLGWPEKPIVLEHDNAGGADKPTGEEIA